MKEKKSLLERLGIVSDAVEPKELIGGSEEKQHKENKEIRRISKDDISSTTIDKAVDFSKIPSDCEHKNVVESAYATLPQSGENIFIVEELLKNYSSLPQQQSYQILQSTLTTMGKDINLFISEAQTRKRIINQELERHTKNIKCECDQIKAAIEAAKAQIDTLSQKNLDLVNGLEVSKKECDAECTRLDMIITVLGGQTNEPPDPYAI